MATKKSVLDKLTAQDLLELKKLLAPGPVAQTVNEYKKPSNDMITANFQAMLRNIDRKTKSQKRVPITISKLYARFSGGYIKVSINGAGIQIPADGKTYQIPESWAEMIKDRLDAYDAQDSDQGFQLSSPNSSAYFNVAGLSGAAVNQSYHGEKLGNASH